MVTIPNLELHVAHTCNLTCESCSHYSNHAHKGLLSVEEADRWMSSWSQRIEPRVVSLLGGEPTINPRLSEFVALAQRHWPRARLRLVTNGFFLHRHPDLPLALRDHPDAFLSLSVHHDDPAYLEKLAPVLKLMSDWVRDHGIKASANPSHTKWTRRYKGFGSAMEPYADGEPRKSWEVCPARFCMQLFEGRLWKCGPIAYLKVQDARYKLSAQWDPYLGYQPLDAGCTDEALAEFAGRQEESCCNMCPARPERFKLPVPLPGFAVRVARSDQAEPAQHGAGPQ